MTKLADEACDLFKAIPKNQRRLRRQEDTFTFTLKQDNVHMCLRKDIHVLFYLCIRITN